MSRGGEDYAVKVVGCVVLQGTKWKGDRARRLVGGCKLLHTGGDGKSNGVGIIVSEEIGNQVVKLESWEERIVVAWLVIRR